MTAPRAWRFRFPIPMRGNELPTGLVGALAEIEVSDPHEG